MIPGVAVDAAFLQIADHLDDTETESWKDLLRTALEAAAPHMLEGAYTDGYCDGMSGEAHNLDKYRNAK